MGLEGEQNQRRPEGTLLHSQGTGYEVLKGAGELGPRGQTPRALKEI